MFFPPLCFVVRFGVLAHNQYDFSALATLSLTTLSLEECF